MAIKNSTIFKQETIEAWLSGTSNSINNEIIQPFQNAEHIIWKYNQAIQYNSLTHQGWQRLLAQSDDSLKAYLTSIKGSTTSMTGYNASLQGSIVGITKVSNAIKQYNTLTTTGASEQNIFTTAISATNSKLGSYLSSLNGTKATLGGYAVSLLSATTKTIALKAATIALNTAMTMGISIAISAVIEGIQYLCKANERYINSQKQIIEKTTDNIQKYEDEITSLNTLQSKLKDAKGDKIELAKIQKDLNEVIGNTPGLLNTESNAYELANQKIQDRINRLKELRNLELDKKITAQKEIFNNSKVQNAWGFDHKFSYFSDHKIKVSSRNYSNEEYYNYIDDDLKNKYVTLQELFDNLIKNNYGNGEKSNADIWKELIDSYGGAFLDTSEIQKFFDEQSNSAKELLREYIDNSDGIFSKEELNSVIETLVESGYAQNLEGIKSVIVSLNDNNELKSLIDEYYNSLFCEENNCDELYQNIKDQFDELSKNYPELQTILNNFFNNISTDVKNNLENTIDKSLSKIKSLPKALSGLDEDAISDYKDKISSLQSYLEKFSSGSYSSADISSLADDFGIIGNSAEETSKKIRKLMDKETKSIVTQIDEILNTQNLDGKTRKALELLKQSLIDVSKEAKNISGFTLTNNALADVQKLSGGLDQLDKIYSDILDKEDFDWSSILNNADFTKTFGAYTKEYNNFINTVSSSPDDINACQGAFNNLVSAFVYGSGVLDEVTEATKAGTIAMLEQMGVSNAAAIVEQVLARNEELRKYETLAVAAATEDMAGKTNNATKELLLEADMSTCAKKALFELVTQQTIFANQDLGFREKINGLKKLAGAYMSVANARTFKKTLDRNIESNNLLMRSGQRGLTLEEIYQKTYDQLSDKLFPDVEIPEPEIIYTGGSTTRDTIENIRKEQEQAQKEAEDARKKALEEAERKKKEEEDSKEQFDWMAVALDKLSSAASKARDKIDDLLTFGAKKRQTQKAIEKTTKAIEAQYKAIKKYRAYALQFSADAAKETTELVTETVSGAVPAAVSGISGTASGVVAEAMKYVNVLPYVWGGTSLTTGADCSGFVQQVYRKSGINIPRTTYEQFAQGTPVSREDLQPGDLVFFKNAGHVGMYAGNGQFIDSPATGRKVQITPLSGRSDYAGARRFSGVSSVSVPSVSGDGSPSETTYTKTVAGVPEKTLAKYRKKVREGGFEVETIKNEKLKNAIKTYQEWWEKVQACKDEIDSLNGTLKELYRTMAEIPLEKRDKKAETIDARMDLLESTRENADSVTVSKKKFRQTGKKVRKSGNAVRKNVRTGKQKNASGLTKKEIKDLNACIKAGKVIPDRLLNAVNDSALYDRCREYNDSVMSHSLYAETGLSLSQAAGRFNSLTNRMVSKISAKTKAYRKAYKSASKGYSKSLGKVSSAGSDVKKILNDKNTKAGKNVIKKIKNCIRSKKEIPSGLLAQFDQSGTFVQTCLAYNHTVMRMNAEKEVLKTAETDWKMQKQESIRQKRERKAEKHQYRADKIQERIDRNEALAENEVLPERKNRFLKKNLKLLKEYYKTQIKIARLEGNSVEAERLKAEWIKEQRDNKIEQHQNLADYYQGKIDRNDTIAENKSSAKDKNEYLKDNSMLAEKRYDELIKAAEAEGDLVKADTYRAQEAKYLNDIRKQIYRNLEDEHAANAEYFRQLADVSISAGDKINYRLRELDELKRQYLNRRNAESDNPQEQERLDAELQGKIGEYYKSMFDDVRTEYEQQISLIRNDMSDLDNEIKKAEASGRRADASFFQHKISMENEILAKLEEEEAGLRERLADIKMYSSEWYEVQDAIQGVQDEQADSHERLREYKDAITEIARTIQNDIVSAFHDINSEADLLITLLGDNLSDSDSGTLTQDGLAALSLYVSQMEVSEKSAASLRDTVRSMQEAADKGILSFVDANGIQRDYASVYELKKDIGDLYSSYRDEIKNTYDYESGIVDLMKQKYQAEADYLKDLTDKKKEALSAEKDLYEYSKNIRKQTDNIESLRKQIAALSGDTSTETGARVQKLQSQLKDAEDELKDAEYDRYISDQQDMLDNLYEEYAALITDLEKNRDRLLQEGLDLFAQTGSGVQDTIRDTAEEYGYRITSGMDGIITSIENMGSLSTYFEADGIVTQSLNNIAAEIQKAYVSITEQMKQKDDSADTGHRGDYDVYTGETDHSTGLTAENITDILETVRDNRDKDSWFTDAINSALKDHGTYAPAKDWTGTDAGEPLKQGGTTGGTFLPEKGSPSGQTGTFGTQGSFSTSLKDESGSFDRGISRADASAVRKLLENGKGTYSKNSASGLEKYIHKNYGTALTPEQMSELSGYLRLGYSAEKLSGNSPESTGYKDRILEELKLQGFSDGGIVKDLKDAVRLNGDRVLVSAKPGEGFLNERQTELFRLFADNMDKLRTDMPVPPSTPRGKMAGIQDHGVERGNAGTSYQFGDMTFSITEAADAKGLMRELQKSHEFERMFGSMVETKLTGRNRLGKYNVRF